MELQLTLVLLCMLFSKDGTHMDFHIKTCAVPAECVNGSLSTGFFNQTFSTKCCSTDLCNRQSVPALPAQFPNGRSCYICDILGKNCSEIMGCEGNQHYCITATVETAGKKMTIKGCSSKSYCTGAALRLQMAGSSSDVKCCAGDLCNSAVSVRMSLLMLTPLLSSTLLH
ncbi:urokinase plasminogen activator surface receptor-like [Brachyhypopomus gauderio]|uniref:urokinase plasminogen activator surface receptor-like n=1 Tax=Brachyhypopomus gauderio TaxID=698409 RepID=UPI004042DA47